MSFIQFLLSFIVLLLVSSFFIVSWYQITRHWIVIQPNGKEKVEGDLLKWWSYYIEKVKRVYMLYYIGEPLHHKFSELNRLLPNIGNKLTLDNDQHFKIKVGLSEKELSDMSAVLSCKLQVGNNNIILYQEEPIYYLPKWAIKPLSGCYKCMASVYGSLFYWGIFYFVQDAFIWSNSPILAKFIFFNVFLITLYGLNCVIGKKSFQYV